MERDPVQHMAPLQRKFVARSANYIPPRLGQSNSFSKSGSDRNKQSGGSMKQEYQQRSAISQQKQQQQQKQPNQPLNNAVSSVRVLKKSKSYDNVVENSDWAGQSQRRSSTASKSVASRRPTLKNSKRSTLKRSTSALHRQTIKQIRPLAKINLGDDFIKDNMSLSARIKLFFARTRKIQPYLRSDVDLAILSLQILSKKMNESTLRIACNKKFVDVATTIIPTFATKHDSEKCIAELKKAIPNKQLYVSVGAFFKNFANEAFSPAFTHDLVKLSDRMNLSDSPWTKYEKKKILSRLRLYPKERLDLIFSVIQFTNYVTSAEYKVSGDNQQRANKSTIAGMFYQIFYGPVNMFDPEDVPILQHRTAFIVAMCENMESLIGEYI